MTLFSEFLLIFSKYYNFNLVILVFLLRYTKMPVVLDFTIYERFLKNCIMIF